MPTHDPWPTTWNDFRDEDIGQAKWTAELSAECARRRREVVGACGAGDVRDGHPDLHWEFHVDETSEELWMIGGIVPPPGGSEAEKAWARANAPSPY